MMTTTNTELMEAGVELIAERGFPDVTVGDIEAAAGFARRGSTLYKHFESKSDLLVPAMQHHVETLDDQDGLDGFTELSDLRSELMVLAKWVLGATDPRRDDQQDHREGRSPLSRAGGADAGVKVS